jgi:hypothetical protein
MDQVLSEIMNAFLKKMRKAVSYAILYNVLPCLPLLLLLFYFLRE